MKIKIFKYIFFIILFVLIIISICIIYKDSKKDVINYKTNKINLNIDNEMNIGIAKYDTINPILSTNRDIQYIDKLIFQSLLDISYDFKIENLLAKEFSKINDTTYIIKLKDDVYWHDGTKFTAKDVIFTINNLKNENINSIYKENVTLVDKVEQIDEYTVRIILKQEVPFFEYKMCFPILASHSYEEETLNSKTRIPIGTGKYKIENIKEDSIRIVVANGENNYKIRNINVLLKKSIKDLYDSFTKKEIDYMITDNIEYEEYIGTMGYNVKQESNREYEYLALNNENHILSNKEIRKAINYAIDKKTINYKVYNSKYIISKFPLDYGSYLNNQEIVDEYDISKAKNILRKEGWIYKNNSWIKSGKKLEFNLIVDENNEKRIMMAKEIKDQLNQIGIILNVIQVNNYKYNTYIKSKKYDMILIGNIVSNCPNVETYFGENNLSNFNNIEIKTILKDIINIENKEIIQEKYFRIIEIYKEEMPFISLYSNSLFVLSKTNIKGDLSFNWYNLFYNIENWYKIKDN